MSLSVKTYYPGDEVAALVNAILTTIYGPEQRKLQPIWKPNEAHHLNTLILFLEEEPIGMARCYLNRGIVYQGSVPLLVGHFECLDHEAGAEKLFQAVNAVALENQCRHIIGPMNGSTWDAYRLMLNVDNPLFFTEPYHPLYYNSLFTNNGFQVISRYASQITFCRDYNEPELTDLKNQLIRAGIGIRPMRKETFRDELSRIYPLCMESFRHNFLYAPIDKGEFLARYLPLADVLQPDLALVAEDRSGTPVAFMLCLPDLLHVPKTQLIIKTIARHPLLPVKGLITVMGDQIYRQAAARGYETIMHAFMHETNRSNQVSIRFGGKLYREYALYGKETALS